MKLHTLRYHSGMMREGLGHSYTNLKCKMADGEQEQSRRDIYIKETRRVCDLDLFIWKNPQQFLPTVHQQLTDRLPTVGPTYYRQLAVCQLTNRYRYEKNCWPTVGQQLANCCPTVGQLLPYCRSTVSRWR